MKRLEFWFQALKLAFSLTWSIRMMKEVVQRMDFAKILERDEDPPEL